MIKSRMSHAAPLVIVMVGLPARGKTYVARKLHRYLTWLGYQTRVFNVGDYRREKLDGWQSHDFFRSDNREGIDQRRKLALQALEDMLGWLNQGQVAIYDATNSTVERRQLVRKRCEAEGAAVLFIESICQDASVIESNIRETKLRSPDYAGMNPEAAVADFRARIAHYESRYESIQDEASSFIKLIDVGRKLIINRIDGYLPARLVYLLMNLHTVRRPIWLTRHGESEDNARELIGGDSSLTAKGQRYAAALREFIHQKKIDNLVVWTSTLLRSVQTADALPWLKQSWRALDEIDAGICDGMTYAQIHESMPDEYDGRSEDKFNYRYPRGESYADVVQRVHPIIVELERQRQPVLIVSHQATLRVLYAYLMGIPQDTCTRLSFPLHTVYQLTPNAHGYDEEKYSLLS